MQVVRWDYNDAYSSEFINELYISRNGVERLALWKQFLAARWKEIAVSMGRK